jgi:hypothetical protein
VKSDQEDGRSSGGSDEKVAAVARNPRAAWGKDLPKGTPTPPFKYPATTRPDNLAIVTQIIRPHRIFRPGRRIFQPGRPETDPLEVFKNRSYFDEKFELVCKD